MKLILLLILLPITYSRMTYQLIFPTTENAPHAKLHGTIDHELQDFTLCHWSRINARITWGSIFSYNTKELDNVIMIWMGSRGNYQLNQNNVMVVSFESGENTSDWVHSCMTSSTLRGEWNVYINGVNKITLVLDNPLTPISPNGVVVLGQDHSNTDGEYHTGHRFRGVIADVFLWDRVLTAKDILDVYACNFKDEANVINWNLHSWELINGSRVSFINLPCGKK